MQRYLLEFGYKGSNYNGVAFQNNLQKVTTVQGEINKALQTILKQELKTTTSSRTDAGVHALQNFLHFDTEIILPENLVYKLNAILAFDINIISIKQVDNDFNCRFKAISREYYYYIHQSKNPFLQEISWRYLPKIDIEKLNACAKIAMTYTDFTSFSKKHSDVSNYNCTILENYWQQMSDGNFRYFVKANRFLRGMVRALVSTMLEVSLYENYEELFAEIIESKNCVNANFSSPAHGLFLVKVNF